MTDFRISKLTALLALQQPRTENALRKNPLGIYVHGLNWSKDLIAGDSP